MTVRSGRLVERERELEALGRLLDAARAGAGGVVVVEGPAGIGKSSLLAAARDGAGELRAVGGRGGELEREFPFGIARQLLEPVLVAADEAERELLLAGAAALAEPVLLVADGDAGGEAPFSALHGLYWLAVNLAGIRPLLVVVDDVQWADLDSLRWLVYLARRLEGVPLALLLAARPAEAGPAQQLLDELAAIPHVRVLEPGDLSEPAVGGLAAELLGAEPDREFVAACHRATGGNPFLLRELLAELSRRAIAPSRESAGLASRLSSRGVMRSVRARLRRLEPGCATLARAVAVLGDPAKPTLAARLAGIDEGAAARAADVLADVAILEPGRPFAFVHPLVRSSVYGELSASERAGEHARAATLLAASGAPADRIAVHLLATDPGGDEDTVATLRAAAESARRRDADDVAASYLRRALREPPRPELEPQLLYELGSAELGAGEIELAVEHLTLALGGTREAPRRALVALELAGAAMLTDRSVQAVDLLTEAIDGLAGAEPELTASLLTMRMAAGWSSLGARRRLPARSDAPMPAGAAPRTTGERLLLGPGAVEEAFTGTAERARSLALRALGDGELLAATGAHDPALFGPLTTLLWAHAFDDAERHFQAALGDARRRGSEVGFAPVSHFRAALCWQRGLLAELEADAQAALAHQLAPSGVPIAAACLAEALVERGDVDAAAAQLRDAGLDAGTPAPLIGVAALVARAHVRLAQGRAADALGLLLECGNVEQAWGVVTPSLTSWRAEAAVLLDRAGEPERARALAAEAVRRADAFGSPVARGVALRAAALVAEPTDHDGLQASADALRGGGATLELARSLIDLGAARRQASRRVDARAPLREALELARACGADAVAARAHDELVAAGARPRRDPTAGHHHLTAGELRVARMAADGMTNREIAQALFVTENTIETHLRHAFRKLAISSRSQLARALAPPAA